MHLGGGGGGGGVYALRVRASKICVCVLNWVCQARHTFFERTDEGKLPVDWVNKNAAFDELLVASYGPFSVTKVTSDR